MLGITPRAMMKSQPRGLEWRSSVWFVTLVVGFSIAIDMVVYAVVIPVFPFRLQTLGYHGVSGLVGWLLFAFSAGQVLFSLPCAQLSERYNNRRIPLISAMALLIGSQILLMEAPAYWVMALARVLQGAASCILWIVGLALLCDTTPERYVGRQLGIAMSGAMLGSFVGPPVGGALYTRFGFHGPIVFGVILAVLDLVGRLLIIERTEALPWGVDPAALPKEEQSIDPEKNAPSTSVNPGTVEREDAGAETNERPASAAHPPASGDASYEATCAPVSPKKHLSSYAVVVTLSKSPRALAAFCMTLIYGIAYSNQEPTLPLHMQAVWGFGSSKVGLVLIAAVVPTLFSAPLSGWYVDTHGTEWISVISLVLAIPFWVLLIVPHSLALFIAALALESFFTSSVIAPVTAELAAISRNIDGIGYAHVYGAFNLFFGLGSAIGPVVGGQIYDHVAHGWTAVCLISAGCIGVIAVLAVLYTGADPLWAKLMRRAGRRGVGSRM